MSAQIKSTPASTSSSATNSTEVSPAFYRFEDPNIDGQLTPLTSVDNTPVNEKEDSDKLVQDRDVDAADGQVQEGIDVDVPPTELEILQARVKESCEGRTQKVEAWGHRGASATCPENTMASFRATCEAGAQGIETDIHITKDDVLVMFHDPELGGKTTGTGKIHETPWHGALEHIRTLEQPAQPLPRFSEVLALLMEPANIHVKLNIDCKVENLPDKLFPMIKEEMFKYEHWETLLAPRIILGIWHPKFILAARRHLPFIPLYAICMSVATVRSFFFQHCVGFSIAFPALYSADGKRFRDEARAAGKKITVFTVNDRSEMLECIRWGVRAVITDEPSKMVSLQEQIQQDPTTLLTPYFQRVLMPWTSPRYYAYKYNAEADIEMEYLEREGGKFYVVQDVINI